MSQRSGSSRPNPDSRQSDETNRTTLSSITRNPQKQPSAEYESSPRYASSPSTDAPSGVVSRPTGPSGIHNLLNPTAREGNKAQGRRCSADQTEGISGSKPSTPQLPMLGLTQGRHPVSLPSITPPLSSVNPALHTHNDRRILTPTTPSAGPYGAIQSSMGLPNGKFDAKASPFMPSQDHASNTSSAPSLPPVAMALSSGNGAQMYPASTGSPAGFPTNSITSQLLFQQERRPSGGASSSQIPPSQSNSPSTSYSSYSRFSRTPPPIHTGNPAQPPSFLPQQYGEQGSGINIPQSGLHGPVSSSTGQGNYQMMTLDTDQGPIQRNATASHRFRQRRKEKERETSQSMERLEHQIRDITEEREFYRMERDYFRSVACSAPVQAHMAPRPPSPRQVRLASLSNTGPGGSSHWQGKEESDRNGRNTRRRTSSYTPAAGFVPPVNGTPAQMPRFGVNENLEQRPISGPRSALIGPPLQSTTFHPPNYQRIWKP